MIEVITLDNMRKSDKYTIENKISSQELMFNAAKGVFNSYIWHDKIGIYCGSGNNAGDGYALALLLNDYGYDVSIVLCSDKFSVDGKYYYDLCCEKNINITAFNDLLFFDIAVDCLLGTGFIGKINDYYKLVIENINRCSEVVSVDINSGLNGDNGICDCAVKSDLTVSIGTFKPGMFLNQAKDYIKKLINKDIGIDVLDKPFYLLEKSDLKNVFKRRLNFSHKGTYGSIGIMGGSGNYPGVK